MPSSGQDECFNLNLYSSNMLKMGSSRPWPDAMEALTGQRAMRADGLLEYFRPLHDWLRAENQRTGEYIGWESSKIRKYKIGEYICNVERKITDFAKILYVHC